VERCWGHDAERVSCQSFIDVTRAVRDGVATYGALPVRNSIVGEIADARAALHGTTGITVIGETALAVHHCLVGTADAERHRLREVLSHPVAIAQCRVFLSDYPTLTVTPWCDTAAAAREVAIRGNPTIGAIASRRAAALHRLQVLAADIESIDGNHTTFLFLSRTDSTSERPR
jgi:prephenate dehydratase